jgi:hypothetical protein
MAPRWSNLILAKTRFSGRSRIRLAVSATVRLDGAHFCKQQLRSRWKDTCLEASLPSAFLSIIPCLHHLPPSGPAPLPSISDSAKPHLLPPALACHYPTYRWAVSQPHAALGWHAAPFHTCLKRPRLGDVLSKDITPAWSFGSSYSLLPPPLLPPRSTFSTRI